MSIDGCGQKIRKLLKGKINELEYLEYREDIFKTMLAD